MGVDTLKPTGPLRRNSLTIKTRTRRLSGNTTRPFTSLETTVKSRNIFLAIIASATSPACAMELRAFQLDLKELVNHRSIDEQARETYSFADTTEEGDCHEGID
jgi:hypothetical protein